MRPKGDRYDKVFTQTRRILNQEAPREMIEHRRCCAGSSKIGVRFCNGEHFNRTRRMKEL